jgi:thiol-disulfide isomerase/thioredoxin
MMMINKLIVLGGLVMVTVLATAQQKSFTITGNIKGKTARYVYLSYSGNGIADYKRDSSRIENRHFSFNGKLYGTTQAMVSTIRQPMSFNEVAQLYLVPADMQLSLDNNDLSSSVVMKGSPVQTEADALNKDKEPLMAKLKPLSDAYNKANMIYIAAMKAKKDEATLDALKETADKAKDVMYPYYKQLGEIDKTFMGKNPASYVTASILRYRISDMPLQEGEERYIALSDDIKNSSVGKEIKETLNGLRKGSPGAKGYVFSSTELRGEPLTLADYKGKYVLVDFWASWCVPCRAGNPHLLSLYSKYKNKGKGLEIISVSDDDGHPGAWKKAVDKDGIGVWKHILRGLKYDGKNFDRTNDISDRYGIHSLPTKILIDPSGMIIGRYGGGGENDEVMDKKLSEIYGG